MKSLLLPLILLTLNFSGGGAAQASEPRTAPVYRCGADGRDLRDSPCPEAPAKAASDVSYDQPAEAEQRLARDQAKADARRAQTAERQRLAEEDRARRENASAGRLSAAPAAPTKPKAERQKKPPKPRKVSKAHPPRKAASS